MICNVFIGHPRIFLEKIENFFVNGINLHKSENKLPIFKKIDNLFKIDKNIVERTDDMKSCCMDYKCIQCCLDTNMILSNVDIERIKELGFDTKFFVSKNRGWLQLKNNNGLCVFHDSISCSIYEHRPEGCKLYPIIYDKDKNCAVFDEDCPHRRYSFEFVTLKYNKWISLFGMEDAMSIL